MQALRQLRTWFAVVIFALAAPAFAMSLQEAMAQLGAAKEQGLVGEQPNGYLGVVKSAGNAEEVVQLINSARGAEYKRLADQNGIKQADVEALAGQKAIERTQSGLYIQINGKWVKKP